MTSERLTSSAPVAVSQKLVEFSVHAELQRHREIHQPDDDRHGSEENHDRAVGGKDLVVVLWRKIARGAKRDRLLRAHHDRVDEPAQQHDHAEQGVHHPDALVVDARDPLAPEVRQIAFEHDPREDRENDQHHDRAGNERDRLAPWDYIPGKFAEHVSAPFADEPSRPRVRCLAPDTAEAAGSRSH